MKFRSKLMSAILAAVMAVTMMGGAFSAFAEDPPEEEDVVVLPAGNFLVVSEGTEMPSIDPGEEKIIEIPVTNTYGGINRVQIEVSLPDELSLNSASTLLQRDRIYRNKPEVIELPLIADADAPAGIYPITLDFSFSYLGVPVSETLTCNIRIGGAAGGGEIIVSDYEIDTESGKAAAGSDFELVLTLINSAKKTVNNGTVSLKGLATGGFTANGETDIKSFSAGPQSAVEVRYKLTADKEMAAGSYPLTVNISSTLGEQSYNIYLPVKGKSGSLSESGDSIPLIVIESYDYGEEAVLGGSTFTLTLNVKNTSTVTAMENIKMTVSSVSTQSGQGGAFTPASSSNTFYISRIAPGETVSESIDLTARTDAVPDSYGISADFSYEAVLDGERQTITAEETITVPVVQPDRFEIGELNCWSPIYMGDIGYVSVNYVNKGKTTVYNLQISAEGNFTTAEKDSYVGNVESGYGDYFELEFSPIEEGNLIGTLIFTYEDANGMQKEVRKEFSTEVISWEEVYYEEPVYEDIPPVELEKSFPWVWVASGAGVVVIAAAVTAVVLKKKKAKALSEEFDDED